MNVVVNKKWFSVFFFIVLFFGNAFSQQSETHQLSKNVAAYFLAENPSTLKQKLKDVTWDKNNGDEIYVELYQRKKPSTTSLEKILKDFKVDGTWTDIDYTDIKASGWQLKNHVDRILLVTKEYLRENSKYYKDQRLKKLIHQGLGYWFKNMPQNDNWWYNEIGIPKSFGPILIMMRNELSKQEYNDGLKVMRQANFGRTGQNKVWQACNVFYKALLTDNEKLAQQARDTIVSEIKISKSEGIKTDFSFHQHGPQQQFGNYGLAFFTTQTSYAAIFANTSFQLDTDKIAILRNLFNQGFNQLTWQGYFDINSLGRQFFKHSQELKALAIGFAAVDLIKVDANNKNSYQQFINRNFSEISESNLTGITNYFTSDMMVYRSKDWYSSIKMSSKRVIGAEAGNNENLKGYYLADGACYISVTGKEYDDIFPLWNWRNLPGVTSFESDTPLKVLPWSGYRNNADFTGGISNGLNGIMAFELNRDSLTAKKSYFFLNNQLICLGAGITTLNTDAVTTTLNQTWLKGAVNYFTDTVKTLKPASEITNQKVNWVYHNNSTYIPLENTTLNISNKTHTGSWHEIIAKYPNDIISGKIFTIKVTPEIKPQNSKYAYAIFPNFKPHNKKVKLNFEIIQNNNKAQIIKSKDNNVFLMTIYKPLKQHIKGLGNLEFKQPGLYQIEKIEKQWKITLADSTQKLNSMDIIFNDKNYHFKMPKDVYKGKSIHRILD
ncbi:polysaccharide lyase family 8 super-sandwich domain-containing protein [Polaribacter sp. IC073]|uniref:polysaccharide lyase family 8 super-sandwich domain-containing protein n=1 Tax=Polaribacter sp. IC073 TaxID=2508540 RepID=UPI0011BDE673|nr:polysaccharide lyase family 8 super-sandwich domain-containing protein [Polaribacter sp. IC073]TXD46772.1 hypothetical protein ES045_12415 [Polaribacter sp. IC073]